MRLMSLAGWLAGWLVCLLARMAVSVWLHDSSVVLKFSVVVVRATWPTRMATAGINYIFRPSQPANQSRAQSPSSRLLALLTTWKRIRT